MVQGVLRAPGPKETPRGRVFCAHIVAQPVTMIVPDALLDPRFAENPQGSWAPRT